jgi:hypothetical protein
MSAGEGRKTWALSEKLLGVAWELSERKVFWFYEAVDNLGGWTAVWRRRETEKGRACARSRRFVRSRLRSMLTCVPHFTIQLLYIF